MKKSMTPRQKRVIEVVIVVFVISILLLLLVFLLGFIADNM
jgi:competence protein ComGC